MSESVKRLRETLSQPPVEMSYAGQKLYLTGAQLVQLQRLSNWFQTVWQAMQATRAVANTSPRLVIPQASGLSFEEFQDTVGFVLQPYRLTWPTAANIYRGLHYMDAPRRQLEADRHLLRLFKRTCADQAWTQANLENLASVVRILERTTPEQLWLWQEDAAQDEQDDSEEDQSDAQEDQDAPDDEDSEEESDDEDSGKETELQRSERDSMRRALMWTLVQQLQHCEVLFNTLLPDIAVFRRERPVIWRLLLQTKQAQ